MGCCQSTNSQTSNSVNWDLATIKTPEFTLARKTQAKVVKVYDGDTCTVCIPIGDEFKRLQVRMYGYDAPELKDKRLEHKQKAIQVRDALRQLIMNQIVELEIMDIKDKYGRCIGIITHNNININQHIIKSFPECVNVYQGGTKQTFEFEKE